MVLNWPEMPLKVPTLRTRGPGAAREGVPDAVPITRNAAVKTSKLLQRISSVPLLVYRPIGDGSYPGWSGWTPADRIGRTPHKVTVRCTAVNRTVIPATSGVSPPLAPPPSWQGVAGMAAADVHADDAGNC